MLKNSYFRLHNGTENIKEYYLQNVVQLMKHLILVHIQLQVIINQNLSLMPFVTFYLIKDIGVEMLMNLQILIKHLHLK